LQSKTMEPNFNVSKAERYLGLDSSYLLISLKK